MENQMRKKRSLTPASDILEDIFKNKRSGLSDGYFLCQLVSFWEDIAGESIAKAGQPVKVTKQELTISLPSSSHLQEMQFIKEELRHKINQRFPNRKIRRIRLKIQTEDSIDTQWTDKILS